MENTVQTYREHRDNAHLLLEHIEQLNYFIDRIEEMYDGHEEPPLEGQDTLNYPVCASVLKDYKSRKLIPQLQNAQEKFNIARNNLEQKLKLCRQAYRLTNVELADSIPEETQDHMDKLLETVDQLKEEIDADNREINQVPF